MEKKSKKKYSCLTQAILMPDGSRNWTKKL